MTHFELFYELSREHLISIWELPLYSMKFFSRPMNVGICTLFIKCMCVYFNFFGMYEGPQNIQIQIQGRSAAACYIKSELRNEVGIFGVRNIRDIFDIKRHRWDMWLETRWAVNKGLLTWSADDSEALYSKRHSTRYAFWVCGAPKQKR